MVEIVQIENLEVDPVGADAAETGQLGDHLIGRAAQTVLAQLGHLPSDRRRPPGDGGLVPAAAHHLGGRKDDRRRIATGLSAHASHPFELVTGFLERPEGAIELGAVTGRQAGRPARTPTSDDDRRAGLLDRLGQAGAVLHPVVATLETEELVVGDGPQPGDDGQLFIEPLETLAHRWEGNPVGGVFGLVPAGPEAELHPPAAHGVDLGHRRRRGGRADGRWPR